MLLSQARLDANGIQHVCWGAMHRHMAHYPTLSMSEYSHDILHEVHQQYCHVHIRIPHNILQVISQQSCCVHIRIPLTFYR